MVTYFNILTLFIIPPIILLAIRTKFRLDLINQNFLDPFKVLVALSIVALIYTTPWDNFLVKEGVWYYDVSLISGLVIFYVPIEEYIFFVLETFLVGLFLLNMNSSYSETEINYTNKRQNILFPILVALFILVSSLYLWGPKDFTYLSLILIWALIPLSIQLVFGSEIIWFQRVPISITIVLSTLYLSVVDFLAINWGIWTISEDYTISNLKVGILPLEEIVFFAVTSTLIVFGLVLCTDHTARIKYRLYTARFRDIMHRIPWINPRFTR